MSNLSIKETANTLIEQFCSCDVMNGYQCGHGRIEKAIFRAYQIGRNEAAIIGKTVEVDVCGADHEQCPNPVVATFSYRNREWALIIVSLCSKHLDRLDKIVADAKQECYIS